MRVIATGTGRCGTKTMAEFFRSQGWTSFHERNNRPMVFNCHDAFYNSRKRMPVAKAELKEMTADKYFEANCHFFPFIREFHKLDPDMKFIILIRDKNEFIKSGSFRKWYRTESHHDKNRLHPPDTITKQEEQNRLVMVGD